MGRIRTKSRRPTYIADRVVGKDLPIDEFKRILSRSTRLGFAKLPAAQQAAIERNAARFEAIVPNMGNAGSSELMSKLAIWIIESGIESLESIVKGE